MNTVNKRKSLRYWLSQGLQMVFIVTVISLAIDWYRTQDMPKEHAPPLSAVMADGEFVDLLEISHEEPVIIYFWATWCPACKFVSPSMSWLSNYYSVFGVSGASGSEGRVTQFMQAKDYRFNNINDPESKVMREWKISVTPTIYIVNKGRVATVTTGVTTPIGILARMWLM